VAGQVIHWDDVRDHPVRQGELDATFAYLGVAAGTVRMGMRRERISSGKRALPPHVHTAEEEIFYVLGGSGVSWQDGLTHEVSAGDCQLHLPGAGAHALIAGADGLDVLACGDRRPSEVAYLPRAGVAWLGPTWVEVGAGDHPWVRDAAAGDLTAGEPKLGGRAPAIMSVADVQAQPVRQGTTDLQMRDVGGALGSRHIGLRHVVLAPGATSFPPHCHSEEEELFVVLEGEGFCQLQRAGKTGWEPEEQPVRPGSLVSLPGGTGVTHALRAGPTGLTYLAYGTREPNDIRWYPRSQKLWFKGVAVMGRVEPLGYWDGEA
jgi:uncharacterized cupin superfamily protein